MFTRMKKANKGLRTLKKGSVLKGFFLQKGQTLMDFQCTERSDPNRKARLQAEQGSPAGEGSDLIVFYPFFPSSKLSPGLSNQPKTPIYLFWQSQSQIANLSPIL